MSNDPTKDPEFIGINFVCPICEGSTIEEVVTVVERVSDVTGFIGNDEDQINCVYDESDEIYVEEVDHYRCSLCDKFIFQNDDLSIISTEDELMTWLGQKGMLTCPKKVEIERT